MVVLMSPEDNKQMIRVGVSPNKTKELSLSLSREELHLITDIWPDWVAFVRQTKQEGYFKDNFFQEIHRSASSKTKRFIDLLGSVVGLGITAVIFIPIAVAIKLDSSGSILYSQVRCGLKGKPFRIWKFRSMFAEAESQQHLVKNEAEGCLFKNQNDSRVTRVGKFLRRTSLDELPQFWNVFKGEMSLVGTRPPTPNEVKNYKPHHYKRLFVKPGITGEWQTNGRSNVKNFDDVVQMDLNYQDKWSIFYDIKLILKTIYLVLLRRGAY